MKSPNRKILESHIGNNTELVADVKSTGRARCLETRARIYTVSIGSLNRVEINMVAKDPRPTYYYEGTQLAGNWFAEHMPSAIELMDHHPKYGDTLTVLRGRGFGVPPSLDVDVSWGFTKTVLVEMTTRFAAKRNVVTKESICK